MENRDLRLSRPSGYDYGSGYHPVEIRGKEEKRSWDLTQVILDRLPSGGILLDVGCGEASKLPPIAEKAGKIVGLDIKLALLGKGKDVIKNAQLLNIELVNGDAVRLPFKDGTFDMVTFMLSPHNAYEAGRVLKPGGYAIVERVGERDKYKLKKLFGSDKEGYRGFRCDLPEGQLVKEYSRDFAEAGFSQVEVKDGWWKTWYTREELIRLLQETPTIRGFNVKGDASILDEAEQKFGTPLGIEVVQHRILVVAQK